MQPMMRAWSLIKKMDLFAWPNTPIFETSLTGRTQSIMLLASASALVARLHTNAFTLACALAGLILAVYLRRFRSAFFEKVFDAFTWPLLLFCVYSLTSQKPESMNFALISAMTLLVKTQWRIRTEQDAVSVLAPVFILIGLALIAFDSLTSAFFSAIAILLMLLGLSCANEGDLPQKTWLQVWRLTKLVALALPWVAALFMLFPRMPFSSSPIQDAGHSGSTGMSDTMSPGSISNLVQNNAPAFFADFKNKVPEKSQLYWRATVFDHFDGITWSSSSVNLTVIGSESHHAKFSESRPLAFTRFQITLPKKATQFLPIPDGTIDNQIAISLTNGFSAMLSPNASGIYHAPSNSPLSTTLTGLMELNATGKTQVHHARMDHFFLQLPIGLNPKTLALAKQAAVDSGGDAMRIAAAFEEVIKQGNYWYSLKPPLLGVNGIDQFLFESRSGFCEHYASAFAVYMRMAGVPARVVTGYHGGEIDFVNSGVRVASRDAHAWTEILANGKWIRTDPTLFINPLRIESEAMNPGLETWPLPGEWGHSLQSWIQHQSLRWKESVIDYDSDVQDAMLSKLGISDQIRHLLTICIIAVIAAFLFSISLLRKAWLDRVSRTSEQRNFYTLRRMLARHGVPVDSHHTGLQIKEMIHRHRADHGLDERLADAFLKKIDAYNRLRYEQPWQK